MPALMTASWQGGCKDRWVMEERPGTGPPGSSSPAPSLPHAGGGRLQDCLPVRCQIEMNVSSPRRAEDSDASTPLAPTAASATRALPWAPEDSVKVKLAAPCSPAPPTHPVQG